MIPVLILGSGIGALGAIRALRRAGIPAFVHTEVGGVERTSRWYRPAPVRRIDTSTPLAQVLDAVMLEQAVLLPCSDAWAREVASLPAAYRDRFPSSISGADTIAQLVDKAGLSRLLTEADVPHPVTRDVADEVALEALPDRVLEGAFLKPRDSQAFFARFGVKAFQVSSRAEALERLGDARASGLAMLLQEYIPGAPDLHYFLDGFVDASGRIRGTLARRRYRMHPRDFGNSSYMESVPREEMAQAIDAMHALVAHTGFRGIFSTEFKRDPRDGLFKLIEVNARVWWYVEFAARCGLDVCSMAYRDALGDVVPEVRDYRVGARLAYPYYDYFACRDARREGTLSLGSWIGSWIGAQQPLFNWDDPRPALLEVWRVAVSKSTKRLKRPQ